MSELVTVRLLDFPLAEHVRSQEHGDELVREFFLIVQSEAEDRDVPERLLVLIDEINEEYGGLTVEPEEVRDAAIARGESYVDLLYRVPAQVKQTCLALDAIIDEIDDYCRAGQLLTLATPPDIREFWRWSFYEFVRQVDGEPPIPWPAYAARLQPST